jgi:hypothetical protein
VCITHKNKTKPKKKKKEKKIIKIPPLVIEGADSSKTT